MSYTEVARKTNNTVITRMVDGNIRVENAVLMFRNFSGNPTNFNPQGGKRTFSLCLPKEWAARRWKEWGRMGLRILKQLSVDYTVDFLLPSKKTFSYDAHFSTRLFFFFFF